MKKNDATKTHGLSAISQRGWMIMLLVAVALGAFLVNDIPSRMRYSATYNQLEMIKKDVMEPAGAVQQPGEEKRGNGVIDTIFNCGPDVSCPTVGAGWYVPVELGKEQEFARTILQRKGYTVTAGDRNPCSLDKTSDCGVSGNKDNYDIGISIRAVGPQAPNPPTTDVSPKIWRDVGMRITY
jgi:hypothetical protein